MQKQSDDEHREMFFKLNYVEQHLSGIATMDVKLLQFNVSAIHSNVAILESTSIQLVHTIHQLNDLVLASTSKTGKVDELGELVKHCNDELLRLHYNHDDDEDDGMMMM